MSAAINRILAGDIAARAKEWTFEEMRAAIARRLDEHDNRAHALVLDTKQKLSDARAALREIKSRHADMDHDVYCPGHKHDNGDCNCPGTDGLIHEGEPCVDGECECCLSIDVIAQALATTAPVAVPATRDGSRCAHGNEDCGICT